DDEGKPGSRAEADVDAVGGKSLLNAGVAAEACDVQVETVLFEDPGALADVGRHERERLAAGLADAQRFRVHRRDRGEPAKGSESADGSATKRHCRSPSRRRARSVSRWRRVALSSTLPSGPSTTP